jgi:hypothetical protein
LWWRLSAGRRFAQGLADLRFEKRTRFLFMGETMIRPYRAFEARLSPTMRHLVPRRLKQLNKIARWVDKQNLRATRACHNVVAEFRA